MAILSARRETPPTGRDLDMAVALEVAGFRWVSWNREAVGGAPLASPGRFLAHPDDLLAHLHRQCGTEVKVSEQSIARVPAYSSNADDAFRAADASGLFSQGEARLRRSPSGTWVIEIPGLDPPVSSRDLPTALCRAALRWVRSRRAG